MKVFRYISVNCEGDIVKGQWKAIIKKRAYGIFK